MGFQWIEAFWNKVRHKISANATCGLTKTSLQGFIPLDKFHPEVFYWNRCLRDLTCFYNLTWPNLSYSDVYFSEISILWDLVNHYPCNMLSANVNLWSKYLATSGLYHKQLRLHAWRETEQYPPWARASSCQIITLVIITLELIQQRRRIKTFMSLEIQRFPQKMTHNLKTETY